MWMQKTMAHLFVEEGRAGWSIAKAMGLAPNHLPFDRAAEGGTWKFFEGKKKLNNSIDQNMFQVIDHCHHDWIWISDIQSQTSRLIHVNTFITSSQNLGRLPLVCSFKFFTDDPRCGCKKRWLIFLSKRGEQVGQLPRLWVWPPTACHLTGRLRVGRENFSKEKRS